MTLIVCQKHSDIMLFFFRKDPEIPEQVFVLDFETR